MAAGFAVERERAGVRRVGGAGDDTIRGLQGNDFGFGDAGNDLIAGDEDNDLVAGGSGDDQVIGGLQSRGFCFATLPAGGR